MKVPLLDLSAQNAPLRQDLDQALAGVIDSNQFILGPAVRDFEAALGEYLGGVGVVGVSSGTDALLLSLMALGIKPGDGVIVPGFTFFATAGVVARLGATPLFADVDPVSFNIDPDSVDKLLDRRDPPARPRAIIPVHLFGQGADMDALLSMAAFYGQWLVEDAAQALSAVYPAKDGFRPLGAMGHAGCYSFFPTKNLGCFGDAGAVVYGNEDLGKRLRSMRVHGADPNEKYLNRMVGANFRIDTVQAAVLGVKLAHLNDWSAGRRANAARYRAMFGATDLPDRELVSLPAEVYADCGVDNHHIYNQFVIRAKDRDRLIEHLAGAGVGHAVYYPRPLHLQPCFAYLGGREGDLPVAEEICNDCLALPIYAELTGEQQAYVVETIQRFYA
jgi:dTDP-4-amino-4,6-dideoxygalactose transaminase